MDEALGGLVAALTAAVQAADLPADGRHTAGWCVGQLPALYAKYCQTSESRYGDEIKRLVRGLLAELAKGAAAGKSQELTANITERFRLLHEQFGLPALGIQPPPAPKPRSRKAG